MYRIILSVQSNRDLDNIYLYIARAGFPDNAKGFVDDIVTFCHTLEAFPNRGVLHPDLGKGLRVLGFHEQVTIVFRVNEKQKRVNISRILYGKQSLWKALGPS